MTPVQHPLVSRPRERGCWSTYVYTSAESLSSLGMEDSTDCCSSSCDRGPPLLLPLLPSEDLLAGSVSTPPLPPTPSSCRRWWCFLGKGTTGWGGLIVDVPVPACCSTKMPCRTSTSTSRVPTSAEASDSPRIDSCRRCSELWMSAMQRAVASRWCVSPAQQSKHVLWRAHTEERPEMIPGG